MKKILKIIMINIFVDKLLLINYNNLLYEWERDNEEIKKWAIQISSSNMGKVKC